MIEFTWPLGVGVNYTLHVTAEREGRDGVKLHIVLNDIDDLTYIGHLIKAESEQIEQHAINALVDMERDIA